MGLYILIFEVFIIVIYGIFVRTGSTISGITELQSPLYFTLAFTLINMKFRMYQWSQLTNYLFIMALTFQMNPLYLMFYDAAFHNTFSATTNLSSYYLMINIECLLAILVTTFQFAGRLTLEQIFALSMIQIFGFALNFSICEFGVKSISGGGTIIIFLFAYIFAVPIKKFCCDQDIEGFGQQKQRYLTLMLKIIGLVLGIILWPNFCSATASVDVYYLGLSSTDYLREQAFVHMLLGFSSAIGTTYGLRILGQKVLLDKFIHTLVMTGIFLSSSSVVIIDPFASLFMGLVAPLTLYFLQKFLSFVLLKGYSVDAIILCVLGGIFDSIFAAGRNDRTPSLSVSATKQGGLQFASLLITMFFSIIFGLLAALILRCFNPRQSINKDNKLWFIDQQTLPIYPDDPILKRLVGNEIDAKLRQQNIFFNLKQSYLTERAKQTGQLGRILRQNIEGQSKIR